jgi:hypothetical protein
MLFINLLNSHAVIFPPVKKSHIPSLIFALEIIFPRLPFILHLSDLQDQLRFFHRLPKTPFDPEDAATGDVNRRTDFGKNREDGLFQPYYEAIRPHLKNKAKYQVVVKEYSFFWGIYVPKMASESIAKK